MQLCLLHLDNALDVQPDFLRKCDAVGADHIRLPQEASAIRLWGHHAELAAFSAKVTNALSGKPEPRLTFMGSGDFHHVSALLLASALEHQPGRVTVVHIDNHPDWVRFAKGIHCGSWINSALEHPQVEKLITIGVCSDDLERPEPKLANLSLLSQGLLELYPYDHEPSRVSNDYGAGASFEQSDGQLRWKTIRGTGEQNFIDYLISRISTEAVYLTIDKDVLTREDAITNWDQGCMQLPYLLSIIEEISSHFRVLGADVIGDYSRPTYSGSLRSKLSKRYEIFKDHPRDKHDPKQAAEINSATNNALLNALSEAMQ
jgi:hypothetical protein